jgi:ubiquinone/menaquinone biosynthesis C-methylase UbiE
MTLAQLIESTPTEGDVRLFSPPLAFDMPEDEYERRIGAHHGLEEGRAVFALYRHYGGNPHGIALELGAGGGAATIGFIEAAREMQTVVTDPSPAFLRIIRGKLQRAKLPTARVTFGTLMGEDLQRIPAGSLDLIFLAACLHHVLDYRQFLVEAARALKPGGQLIVQEPFVEGQMVMAMALEHLLGLDTKAFALKTDDRTKLLRMLHAMYFQMDRRADKRDHEDKHTFLTDDLLTAASGAFADVHFFRNQSFASIGSLPRIEDTAGAGASGLSMVEYLRSFMKFHHLISDATLARFDQYVVPRLARVDELFRQGDGPAVLATVVCRKAA